MTRHEPKLLGNVIAGTLRELGIYGKIKQFEMLDRWPDIVGEQIAKVTTAEYVSDGKLFVRVALSTWRHELVYLKKELIEKINAAMREETVRDIVFR